MRVRFALAAILTLLVAAPLAAQPFSSGKPSPGSWAHERPFYPSQAYFEHMAYGGDGYWEYFGGGNCPHCDPCSGHWGGFFRKCTTVNGCPYWASDPCCRTILSEMACDVKCFCSTMHCSNHTRMRAALCRALCQDCSYCGGCAGGCSVCSTGSSQGYHSKPAPPDSQVDPFQDDAPRGRGAYYSPYAPPAPARSRTAREPAPASVLRADHAEPLVPTKDQTPARTAAPAERHEEPASLSDAERYSQYHRAQTQAQEAADTAAQQNQLAQQYAQLQQQYLAAQQAQQQAVQQLAAQQQAAQQAAQQYAAQQQAAQYAAQQMAAQQAAAQQLAAQQAAAQYAAQQAARQQAAVQYYAQQQQALQQQLWQQQAVQQQAAQQQYMQQMAAQQYAARFAAQQAAAMQQAQSSVLMPQPTAPQQLLVPPAALPQLPAVAPTSATLPAPLPQPQATTPQAQPTAIYWMPDPPEAPRTLDGGTITADATSRTADTGVEMSILSRR